MTLLTNLLLYVPGHSGFSNYVRRVLPGLPGERLLLDGTRGPICRSGDCLPDDGPTSWRMGWLQRLSLTQHGVDLQQALATAGLRPADIELAYSPYCDVLFALQSVPQVITCHDITPLFVSNSRKATWRYRLWTPVHLRRARRIIAISRFVADQLVDFGVPAGKIDMVWNGVAVERERLSAMSSHDLIMLARHDANKNVAYVIRAFGRLQSAQPLWRGRLVVVGRPGRETPRLLALQRSLPRPEQLVILHAIDGPALIRLLRQSMALISASCMEGFDYPVLEAKAEGLPTLVSKIPVHQELHESSSMLFSLEDDGDALIEAITRLAQDETLWTQLSQDGYEMARIFTLERQRQQIRQVLRTVDRSSSLSMSL